jgi:hypothetical protein
MTTIPPLQKRLQVVLQHMETLNKKLSKSKAGAARDGLLFDVVDDLVDLGQIWMTERYKQKAHLREAALRRGREIPKLPYGKNHPRRWRALAKRRSR